MHSQSMSRRGFLKASAIVGAAVVGATMSRDLLAAEDYGGHSIPVGLQLYTVGRDMSKDLDATIEKVAKIGYKGVEFAGYYGKSAKDLRKLLDANGLKCCGTHVPGGMLALDADNFQKTVDFAKEIGCPNLIVASMRAEGKQGWEKAAEHFNHLSDKLEPMGLRIGYHCHPPDFKKVDGETTWDIFCSNTKKQVITQCDIGHMGTAGVDPVMYLNKYPGRALSVHVKPSSRIKHGELLGEDELNWPAIFKACETVGGTQWYIVEYDGGSMEKAEKTMGVLRKWGKVV